MAEQRRMNPGSLSPVGGESRLLFNAAVNVAARLVTVVARFLIVPFAIGVMGRSAYGAWVIVGQIFAYTRILEMGLRASVTREAAICFARGQPEALNRPVNTAGAYYSLVGLLVILLTVLLAVVYPSWFDVDPAHHAASRVMVVVAGATLAATIPLYAYGAVAAGLQRFDIISGSQILGDVVRVVLIFAFLPRLGVGGGLVLLAVASGGTTLLAAALRAVLSFRLWPHGRFEPWIVDRSIVAGMAGFGINTVVFVMSITAAAQAASIIVGAILSPAHATDFRVAMEIIVGLHAFVVACTVGISPAASQLFGEDNPEGLRRLLVDTTRYGALVAWIGVFGLLIYGGVFLSLWMGENYCGDEGRKNLAGIVATTKIMGCGHALFWLMLPAFRIVNGMGHHRLPALLATFSVLVSVVLAVLAAIRPQAAITDVAWSIMVPIIPGWAVILPLYCCRTVGQSPAIFLWRGLCIPALGCLPGAALAYGLARLWPVPNWPAFLVQLGIWAVLLTAGIWFVVMNRQERARVRGGVAYVFQRSPA